MPKSLTGKRVLIGISGGIALYKVGELVRLLKREGCSLRIVLTTGAEQFVRPTLFAGLSGEPVFTNRDFFTSQGSIHHVELARYPDLVLLLPATASLISKLAAAEASELLLAVLLATRAPVFIFPSMNSNMYNHPGVQANLDRLRAYGYKVFPPASGELACGEIGEGRLPEPESIAETVKAFFKPKDLSGVNILINAGPTREYIDEVRFITNASTGQMGYALAREAYARGAQVHLVWGLEADPVFPNLEPLHGVPKPRIYKVKTTEDMFAFCQELFPKVKVAILASAPCDFKPIKTYPGKIKKTEKLTLELRQTVDIAKTLEKQRKGQLFVGFALEEEDKIEVYAKQKRLEKGFDLLVANPISAMGSQKSNFLIYTAQECLRYENISKEALSTELLNLIVERLRSLPS